jgi:hypothetical protein
MALLLRQSSIIFSHFSCCVVSVEDRVLVCISLPSAAIGKVCKIAVYLP